MYALLVAILTFCWGAGPLVAQPAPVRPSQPLTTGWLGWRGPTQDGVSTETLRVSTNPAQALWTDPLHGRGTPVVGGDHVYALGYEGSGADLREALVCLDARTGRRLWDRRFNDFLSDIIYERYSIGSPVVDPATGAVYVLTSAGILTGFSADGAPLWERSLMEELGRMTFPNGRTGAPVVDGDRLIVHSITANWGEQGPARDRFYAFDTATGALIWASTPGEGPRDNSFSTPVLGWLDGRRVFYAGTGCGNVVCVDARTGAPVSRFALADGGINSSVVALGDDRVAAIQGVENVDSSETGRMVALSMRPTAQTPVSSGAAPVAVLGKSAELWRNGLGMFTSSPVRVDNRIFQVTQTGELCIVDATTGTVTAKEKLGTFQLHASPLFAGGRLYVPMEDGQLHIVAVRGDRLVKEGVLRLEGSCLGAPSAWGGRLYVHTTARLYCFGEIRPVPGVADPGAAESPQAVPAAVGPPVRLQARPSEVLLGPGQSVQIETVGIDRWGASVALSGPVTWEPWIPPTAKVRARMAGGFTDSRTLKASPSNGPSAGAYRARAGSAVGTLRGRVLPEPPIHEDFEKFDVTVAHEKEVGVRFAYPPLPWIGARFKFEVRDLEGDKVLTKTLDQALFQRAVAFIGAPHLKAYTLAADVMSDGNRRTMSDVGLVNQRYLVALLGNWQTLEVSSNQERLKVSVPFPWHAGRWYRLLTRVDRAGDGTCFVRVKAWPRDSREPSTWTLEVPHKNGHVRGAPGIYAFTPQNQKRVYIDDVSLEVSR